MELKVWVEGIQRTVCGVTDKTTCQDVVYALAHATGKTGRFTLIESWRNNERLLAPQEHPLKVLNKWGEYSQEVQFILQRSSLDGMKNPGMLQPGLHHPGHQFKQPGPMLSPQMSRANLGPPAHPYAAATASGIRPPHHSAGPPGAMGGLLAKAPAASHPTTTMGEPPAVWKPPPPGYPPPPQGHGGHTRKGGPYHPASGSAAAAASNNNHNEVGARLSPDSGRGSDKTGSDTSNSYTENNKDSSSSLKNNNGSSSSKKQQVVTASQNGGYNGNVHRSQSTSQMGWGRLGGGGQQTEESPYGFSKQTSVPVLKGGGALPPPAYKPPPNPASSISSASPADQPPPYREPPPPPGGGRMLRQASSPSSGLPQPQSTVRPPHYSPPPTHKTHLSRHPSRTSLVGAAGGAIGASGVGSSSSSSLARTQHHHPRGKVPSNQQQHPPTEMTELLNLVTAQQSTLQAQQADIRQFEAEEAGFSTHGESSVDTGAPTHPGGVAAVATSVVPSAAPAGSQMDLVLSEVRRLEELSQRNDDELKFLNSERAQMESETDTNIRSEIMQLKQRLAGTDVELQRTNTTLRRLGDEMRNMSLEKTRQREQELVQEADRLQNEIKLLQKSSEDSANISQQLSKDVKEVEGQIRQRKSEVEQLIKEMREANMESLTISPPEESKQFLEGPPKPNTSRKMMGSPRQLENAVPTSRNPHGVWV